MAASIKEVNETSMTISPQLLTKKVEEIYGNLCKLKSLKPCKAVNTLLTQLVALCSLPCSGEIDMRLLTKEMREIRDHLIHLCAEAEGLLESHYSSLFGQLSSPLSIPNLRLFPYYNNYRKLAALEYAMLCKCTPGISWSSAKARVAFVGSGPLPLTCIMLATHHLVAATFDNYDMDVEGNALASKLVHSQSHDDVSLSGRMRFITCDILHVSGDTLGCYDVIFLAALVGLRREEKIKIVSHVGNNMKAGGVLMARSAHEGKAFLYPILEEEDIVRHSPLQIVSVLHPTNEVINSIIVAQKP